MRDAHPINRDHLRAAPSGNLRELRVDLADVSGERINERHPQWRFIKHRPESLLALRQRRLRLLALGDVVVDDGNTSAFAA